MPETPEIDWRKRFAWLIKTVGTHAKCKSCKADIWWVVTRAGNSMPISQAGVAHFADCPDAGKHRKRG